LENIEAEYACAAVWDERHASLLRAGTDRNQSEKWLACFLPALSGHNALDLLDLGCGTGYDSLELARRGMRVTGIDYSEVAVAQARAMALAEQLPVKFREVDIARPLPFPPNRFDAVISNLVLHSFSKDVTRRIIAEVKRSLKPGGLFLFHANSTEDRLPRLKHQRPARELEPDFYLLDGGQTMHFMSEEFCRELLAAWSIFELQHVRTFDTEGNVLKCAWRCIAQKPFSQHDSDVAPAHL
jgi:SAM-dependent methyltransferase